MAGMLEQKKVCASVLHGARDLRLEQRAIDDPAPDEVQIAIIRTGLCGSDLHYFQHYKNGDIEIREPLTLGHESSGKIVGIGSAVEPNNFQLGDTVALEVGVPCESSDCEYCASGRYNLCSKMRFRSSAKSFPHFQGTLQERINHPARWTYRLPPEISAEAGALLEPLSVALHAIRRANVPPEKKNILVLGAGAVGLLLARCLVERGHYVVIADISTSRTEFARKDLFASRTVTFPMERADDLAGKLKIAKNLMSIACQAIAPTENGEKAFDSADNSLFDISFECTGVEVCVQTAIYASKSGGKIALVGMGQPIQTLHLAAAALREVDIVGVFRYAGNYTEGIQMLSSGRFSDLEKLITHRFQGFDAIPKAFDMAARMTDDEGNTVIKVMVGL